MMAEELLGYLTWPAIGIALVIAMVVLVKMLSAYYVRVPPNKAGYFYGARSGKKGIYLTS